MHTLSIEQRSPEWYAARCGSLGASSVHEVIARTKSAYSASRQNCLARLVVERLTGKPTQTYQNAAMLHGIETEPEARNAYSFYSSAEVTEVGLVRHPALKGSHASPDGLVGDAGLVEIKCPQPAGHLAVLLGDSIPDEYIVQMLWQMRCADRAWCDFASYQPDFPEHLKLWVKRIERDDKRIAAIEDEVAKFLGEVEAAVAKLGGNEIAPHELMMAG